MDEATVESLKQLKKILLSLVCSNSSRMDVNNLKRDYADQERDGRIPVNKYGHRDLIAFLTAECRDIFQFEGNPHNPFLVPIVPKALKSLNDLVVKQKTAQNKSYQVKRSRGIDAEAGNILQFRPKPRNNDYHADTNGYRKSDSGRKPYRYDQNNRSNYTFQNGDYSRNANENSHYQNSRYYNDDSQSRPDKPAPINYIKPDPEPLMKTLIHQSTLRVNQKIVDNLKNLLDAYEEGIWSLDILPLYERKFHIDLPLSYQTVLALCRDLPDVFKVVRPNKLGDWRVFAANAVIPDCYREGSQKFTKSNDEQGQTDCEVDIFGTAALPGFGFDPSLYPPECAPYGVCLPRLSPLVAGRTLDVLLAEVRDPSHFWFQLDSLECALALEAMMDDMDKYYLKNPTELPMVRAAARIAQLCAVPYAGRFHRALVIKNVDFNTVKIRYVDYGTVCDVAANTMRMLHLNFTKLPAQALRGRLASVAPCHTHWGLAACQAFMGHVNDKYLVAEVTQVIVDKIPTYELRLFERRDGNTPDFLADRLIAANLAVDPSDLNNREKHYLLPTFDDIENGLVGPWEPPVEPKLEEEVVATEAIPDSQGGSTPSQEDVFEDCIEINSSPISECDNVSSGSAEFLPKLEEPPFPMNPSSVEFLPKLEEQLFPINPNIQQVFINHVSLPQGKPYENASYPGFQSVQPFQHFFPPQQQHPPPPPYGYNHPPPYQYYQDPRDYHNYMPPYYVNSQWGMHGKGPLPMPLRNYLPSPTPIFPPNHIRPSVNMVKQYSTNLREVPKVTDHMENLSISCEPQSINNTNVSQKNNIEKSLHNLRNHSSPSENLIKHEFQQHSNLVQIEVAGWDGPKEKSDVTTYSVDDISSEDGSYDRVSEAERSSPASVQMYTLELVDIADLCGKPVEIWLYRGELHVILQQMAQSIMRPEGARDFVDAAQGLRGPDPAHHVIQDDYVVGDMIRKIEETGTTTYSKGISIRIICKKNLSMDKDFILLVPLARLFDFTCSSRQNFSVDITDVMRFIISVMKKHSNPDDSEEDSDDD